MGGLPARASGENLAVVERLERAGARLLRTRSIPVLTGARSVGRALGGFAQRLRTVGDGNP